MKKSIILLTAVALCAPSVHALKIKAGRTLPGGTLVDPVAVFSGSNAQPMPAEISLPLDSAFAGGVMLDNFSLPSTTQIAAATVAAGNAIPAYSELAADASGKVIDLHDGDAFVGNNFTTLVGAGTVITAGSTLGVCSVVDGQLFAEQPLPAPSTVFLGTSGGGSAANAQVPAGVPVSGILQRVSSGNKILGADLFCGGAQLTAGSVITAGSEIVDEQTGTLSLLTAGITVPDGQVLTVGSGSLLKADCVLAHNSIITSELFAVRSDDDEGVIAHHDLIGSVGLMSHGCILAAGTVLHGFVPLNGNLTLGSNVTLAAGTYLSEGSSLYIGSRALTLPLIMLADWRWASTPGSAPQTFAATSIYVVPTGGVMLMQPISGLGLTVGAGSRVVGALTVNADATFFTSTDTALFCGFPHMVKAGSVLSAHSFLDTGFLRTGGTAHQLAAERSARHGVLKAGSIVLAGSTLNDKMVGSDRTLASDVTIKREKTTILKTGSTFAPFSWVYGGQPIIPVNDNLNLAQSDYAFVLPITVIQDGTNLDAGGGITPDRIHLMAAMTLVGDCGPLVHNGFIGGGSSFKNGSQLCAPAGDAVLTLAEKLVAGPAGLTPTGGLTVGGERLINAPLTLDNDLPIWGGTLMGASTLKAGSYLYAFKNDSAYDFSLQSGGIVLYNDVFFPAGTTLHTTSGNVKVPIINGASNKLLGFVGTTPVSLSRGGYVSAMSGSYSMPDNLVITIPAGEQVIARRSGAAPTGGKIVFTVDYAVPANNALRLVNGSITALLKAGSVLATGSQVATQVMSAARATLADQTVAYPIATERNASMVYGSGSITTSSTLWTPQDDPKAGLNFDITLTNDLMLESAPHSMGR